MPTASPTRKRGPTGNTTTASGGKGKGPTVALSYMEKSSKGHQHAGHATNKSLGSTLITVVAVAIVLFQALLYFPSESNDEPALAVSSKKTPPMLRGNPNPPLSIMNNNNNTIGGPPSGSSMSEDEEDEEDEVDAGELYPSTETPTETETEMETEAETEVETEVETEDETEEDTASGDEG
jgi:hypothetical protein